MKINIDLDVKLLLRIIGIVVAIAIVPGLLAVGWDYFLAPVTGLVSISYFNACAAVSLFAFVMVLIVCVVVVIKELL